MIFLWDLHPYSPTETYVKLSNCQTQIPLGFLRQDHTKSYNPSKNQWESCPRSLEMLWCCGRFGGPGVPDLHAAQRLGLRQWHGVTDRPWPGGLRPRLWRRRHGLLLRRLRLSGGYGGYGGNGMIWWKDVERWG